MSNLVFEFFRSCSGLIVCVGFYSVGELDACYDFGHSAGCKFKKVVTPDGKRQAVGHLCGTHGVSQRRACAALQVDLSTVRYQSKRPDDSALRDEIKLVAKERRRFGYRRIQVMLERPTLQRNANPRPYGIIRG